MGNKCTNCRYGVEFDREIDGKQVNFIECRRYPPEFNMIPTGTMQQLTGQWAFRVVNIHAWCGEFAPKEDDA